MFGLALGYVVQGKVKFPH